jgi:hypothetical protein
MSVAEAEPAAPAAPTTSAVTHERAYRVRTRAGRNGHVEADVPDLADGEDVDLIIVPRLKAPPPREVASEAEENPFKGLSILEMVEKRRAMGIPPMFKTGEEVDEYIRKERESWD